MVRQSVIRITDRKRRCAIFAVSEPKASPDLRPKTTEPIEKTNLFVKPNAIEFTRIAEAGKRRTKFNDTMKRIWMTTFLSLTLCAGACAQCQRQECRHPDSFHRIVEFRSSFSRLGNSSKLDCIRLNEKVRFFDRFRRLRAQVRRRLRFRHCKNSASALPVRYTDHGLSYHYYGCRVKTEKMRNFAKVSKCRDHGERIETGSCRTV